MPYEKVDSIIGEILAVTDPKIDSAREPQIRNLIGSTVNGDTVSKFLTISANLGKEKGAGVIAYILTNARLIKAEIDTKSVESISPSLESMLNIDRKITGDMSEILLKFRDASFGLRYPSIDEKINTFFQEVDQARLKARNVV